MNLKESSWNLCGAYLVKMSADMNIFSNKEMCNGLDRFTPAINTLFNKWKKLHFCQTDFKLSSESWFFQYVEFPIWS